jgi:hypothetical protein
MEQHHFFVVAFLILGQVFILFALIAEQFIPKLISTSLFQDIHHGLPPQPIMNFRNFIFK